MRATSDRYGERRVCGGAGNRDVSCEATRGGRSEIHSKCCRLARAYRLVRGNAADRVGVPRSRHLRNCHRRVSGVLYSHVGRS